MLNLKINEEAPQAKELIAFLRTLSFVEFEEEEGPSDVTSGKQKFEMTILFDPYNGLYDIKDLAENLDMGMKCFVHEKTGEIVFYPQEALEYGDTEEWQEIIDRAENDADFIFLRTMESWESFEIMEDFVEQLRDKVLKKDLEEALLRRKPFRNFNNIIHGSEFRQEWFDFKNRKYQEFVLEQLKNHFNKGIIEED